MDLIMGMVSLMHGDLLKFTYYVFCGTRVGVPVCVNSVGSVNGSCYLLLPGVILCIAPLAIFCNVFRFLTDLTNNITTTTILIVVVVASIVAVVVVASMAIVMTATIACVLATVAIAASLVRVTHPIAAGLPTTTVTVGVVVAATSLARISAALARVGATAAAVVLARSPLGKAATTTAAASSQVG